MNRGESVEPAEERHDPGVIRGHVLDSFDYRFTLGVAMTCLAIAPICLGGTPGIIVGAIVLAAGLLVAGNN